MQTIQLDAKKAPCKWFAIKDVARRSEEERPNYYISQQVAANLLPFDLARVYVYDKSYITFRKKFIAIKLAGAAVKSKRNLNKLEKDFAAKGISKIETAQGIIYRIPKVNG